MYNSDDEFRVGTAVAVRNEYRNNPSLKGAHEGTITQANRVGVTMIYTVDMNGHSVNITHGVLEVAKVG